ncbi:MAG: aminotransferase class IV [Bacteroidales bacterium]|nr:aminotransferase class IV [Bacteroidales bacterium]
MEEIRGNFVILNGHPVRKEKYIPEKASKIYYEVIRMIDGGYLFLEDHLERLKKSCNKHDSNCPSDKDAIKSLEMLAKRSGLVNGNVKILVYSKEGRMHTACYFTPHYYPAPGDYKNGIQTRTFSFNRPDPNVKQWNEKFRKEVKQFIQQENIYEAILLSKEGNLTEGSRSNLFFIDQEGVVITAPSEAILPGITRKYVVDLCEKNRITVSEKLVDLDFAQKMTSCFITGTSPKVLPVRCLNNIEFDTGNEVLQIIRDSFDQLLQEHLKRK